MEPGLTIKTSRCQETSHNYQGVDPAVGITHTFNKGETEVWLAHVCTLCGHVIHCHVSTWRTNSAPVPGVPYYMPVPGLLKL